MEQELDKAKSPVFIVFENLNDLMLLSKEQVILAEWISGVSGEVRNQLGEGDVWTYGQAS